MLIFPHCFPRFAQGLLNEQVYIRIEHKIAQHPPFEKVMPPTTRSAPVKCLVILHEVFIKYSRTIHEVTS